jgi:hypothetical protein
LTKDPVKFKEDKIYHKVGNEWISIDQFLTKDQVIKLINIMGNYLELFHYGKLGMEPDMVGTIINQLVELREELKK